MIKKVLFFLLFSFPLLAGCGSGGTNGTVPVHLNLVFPAGDASPASPLSKRAAPAPPTGVHTPHPTRLTLEVTGPGMATISLSPEILPSGEVTINLNIPAGSARRFTITAFDANGNVISRGESTVDLRLGDSSVNITVNLVSVAPKPKPIPRFAYVANQGSNTVSIYTVSFGSSIVSLKAVNLPNGQLRANGYVTVGTGTSTKVLSATLDPLGRFVYVVNASTSTSTPGTISSYTINQSTGALTNTSVINTDGPFPGDAATIDPSGRFLYVSNESTSSTTASTISSYTIDLTTGALIKSGTVVGNGDIVSPVFIDPLGMFAYEADGDRSSTSTPITFSIYTINQTTGILKNTGTAADIGIKPSAGALHPSGQFAYVANESTSTSTPGTISTYTINPTTGAFKNIGPPVATDVGKPSSVAIDTSERFAYVANEGNQGNPNTISGYTINPDGTLTSVGAPVVAGLGRPAVTVDPSGKFVYVTNAGSNDILTYNIDPTTGALTPTGNIRTQSSPQSIAVSGGPSPVTYTPKFAYAANEVSGTVSAYTIDPSQGTLKATSTQSIGPNSRPSFITSDPTGRFAYVADPSAGTVFVYAINAASGALTQVDATSTPFVVSITVDPSGRFAYAVQNSNPQNPDPSEIATYSIDPLTGVLTQVGTPLQTGGLISSLTIDPTGRFGYVASFNQITVFQISPTTGSLTIFPPFQAGQNLLSSLVDPTGKFAYFIDRNISVGPSFILPFTINSLDGTLATGTPIQVGSQPVAMAVEPSGRFVYLVDAAGANGSISAFQIDPKAGALVPFGQPVPTGVNPKSITIDVSGKFVYVGNDDTPNGNISTYTISPADGTLTPIPSTVPTGTGPVSITSTGIIQ